MNRRHSRHGLAALLVAFFSAAAFCVAPAQAKEKAAPGTFFSLCYHNVEDSNPDQNFNSVTTSRLIEQLSWLKHEGYHPVSVDDLLAARTGRKPLPPKALLLTFDDGYESFYTRVYPVLKAFHFPAVEAVVDEWMVGSASHPGDRVNYGDTTMPRDAFLTWEQIREMQRSGLVEIASHSHALHYGMLANPQNNTEPAVITASYDPDTHSYESEEHYAARLRADAKASSDTILKQTGRRPRVMVWPYGAYNQMAINIALQNGMSITLSLDDGLAKVDAMSNVPRFLIKDDPNIENFAVYVRQADKVAPVRVVQVDLDYVYDDDKKQMAKNIDDLVERIHDMKINTVFLQAFADPKGTGLATQVYFPSRVLPMRADLFNHVAWQLSSRANVKVFGWLPVLSFDFGDAVTPVMAWNPKTGEAAVDPKAYHRVSPFDPEARKKIITLYEDMARHGPIDGILYHDDAMLSDFEDASPAALEAYRRAGLPGSIAEIRADKGLMRRWTEFKTKALIDFTQELTRHVKIYRAPLVTVRNIYAPLLLDPESESWFAQNYARFLASYDYTAVEAMPRMENVSAGDADAWMNRLVDAAAAQSGGLKHTIFELQSVDWREQHKGNDRAVPTDELRAQMRLLTRRKALNFGYYPDDFHNDIPDADEIHKDFSLQTYPYTP